MIDWPVVPQVFIGVETQALQYLADFSKYQGQEFIHHFSKNSPLLKENIENFLGDAVSEEEINRRNRIILIARSFDQALFSMGEWLASRGVAFRCIEYLPFEVDGQQFLSFSVAFDRSPEPLYTLSFQHRAAREPGYFWHNVGHDSAEWWEFLVKHGKISAGFENQRGDQGEQILRGYVVGDIIIAYASGRGAVGYGEIKKPGSYKLVRSGDKKEDLFNGHHLHRLDIEWQATAPELGQAIPASELKEQFGIYPPIRTSVSIAPEKARLLVEALAEKFSRNTNMNE